MNAACFPFTSNSIAFGMVIWIMKFIPDCYERIRLREGHISCFSSFYDSTVKVSWSDFDIAFFIGLSNGFFGN